MKYVPALGNVSMYQQKLSKCFHGLCFVCFFFISTPLAEFKQWHFICYSYKWDWNLEFFFAQR